LACPQAPVAASATHLSGSGPGVIGLVFYFAVRSEHLHSTLFRLTTIIQTPGYCATEKWVMICEGGMLTLHDPSHPKTRTA
jgi:hypothetical protein